MTAGNCARDRKKNGAYVAAPANDKEDEEKRAGDSIAKAAKETAAKRGVESPEDYSSFASQMTFSWFTSLAWTGYKRGLAFDDLWRLPPANSCLGAYQAFQVSCKKTFL